MKVLLVNGSPRQKGNTDTALGEVAAQLQKNDFFEKRQMKEC